MVEATWSSPFREANIRSYIYNIKDPPRLVTKKSVTPEARKVCRAIDVDIELDPLIKLGRIRGTVTILQQSQRMYGRPQAWSYAQPSAMKIS